MSNHTPGPWTVETNPDIYGGYRIVEAGEEQETWVDEGYEVSDDEGERRSDVAKERDTANALLIEAAPDLLDFAEVAGGFIAWAKDNGADLAAMDGLEQMRLAAIAKAKGHD